jgi:ribose transport system substrate-binding protein
MKKVSFRHHFVWFFQFCILAVAGSLIPIKPVLAYDSQQAEETREKTHLSLDEMQRQVAEASVKSPAWNGPKTGPVAAVGKTIAIISEDLRNGGILGVAEGVREASKAIGWKVRVFDAGGTSKGRDRAASMALASHPDGVVLDGADAEVMRSRLQPFVGQGIPIVGWHVGPVAGTLKGSPVSINVSTDPLAVARITAMAAIVASKGHARVVIFTDSNFKIAMAKANAMADIIRGCPGCKLLEIYDVAISQSAEAMPAVIRKLLAKYGNQWTYGLAINDIYFDYTVPELILAGTRAKQIRLLSAGDGSSAAFLRIQSGTFQVGTVAEPLNLQGWQLVDELNRLLHHQPVSGYVVPVHLVTPQNVMLDGGRHFRYDPANSYRNVYRQIWGR